MSARSRTEQRLLLLVLVFAPLIPLWRCVFYGEAIGAFEQIGQFAPWNQPTDGKPWDVLQADGVLQFYPWRQLVFDSWSKWHIPFWNPYELAGTPLLANSQSGALYPLHILCGLAQLSAAAGMFLLAWFHLAWAGLGVYFLARQYSVRRTGALVAGLTFSLSPFMLAWTALPSVITTVSWIPWVLAFVIRTARNKTPRERTKAACWGAGSVGMMLLAGHLQFAAYGLLAAAIILVIESFSPKTERTKRRRKRETATGDSPTHSTARRRPEFNFGFVVRACLSLVAGIALSAPQLLPVLNYSSFSHRRSAPTAEGYQQYVAASIKPYSLGTLDFATLDGNPTELPDGAPPDKPSVSSYWPQLLGPYMPFAESAIGLGPLALALLFLAPWKQRRRGMVGMGVLGGVALLLGLGTPLNYLLYFFVPGWSATGSPGRVMVLFVLAASIIAGIAVDRLSTKVDNRRSQILSWILPGLLIIPALLFSNLAPIDGDLRALADSAQQSAMPWMLAAAAIATLTLAATVKINKVRYRTFVILSPMLICLLQGGCTFIRTGDPATMGSEVLTPKQDNGRVAVINQGWGIALAARALAPANILSVFHIREISGYDSLLHRDTVEMLREIDGKDPAPEANGNMMFVKPTADPLKLADAGVSEVWSLGQLPQFGEPYSREGGYYRYLLSGPGRVSISSGPAEIVREDEGLVQVKATGPGHLVLRDRNMPGWRASISGVPVQLEGTRWREVDVPAGEQMITFRYTPPGYAPGWIIFFVSLAGIVAVLSTGKEVSRPKA